jgi:hypothetical protein
MNSSRLARWGTVQYTQSSKAYQGRLNRIRVPPSLSTANRADQHCPNDQHFPQIVRYRSSGAIIPRFCVSTADCSILCAVPNEDRDRRRGREACASLTTKSRMRARVGRRRRAASAGSTASAQRRAQRRPPVARPRGGPNSPHQCAPPPADIPAADGRVATERCDRVAAATA